jgi:hypothetical protein
VIAIPIRRAEAATGVGAASFLEVGMHAGLFGRYAAGGVVDEHHFEEVETGGVEIGDEGDRVVTLPFGE